MSTRICQLLGKRLWFQKAAFGLHLAMCLPQFSHVSSKSRNQHKIIGNITLFCLFTAGEECPKVDKGKEEKEDVIHKIALTELAIKDGDILKAERNLEEILFKLNDSHIIEQVSKIYDSLANIAYEKGEAIHAENLILIFIEQLIKNELPIFDDNIISFNLKLSLIYSKTGEDELAEIGFQNCLAVQRYKMSQNKFHNEDSCILLINILFWYGKFLLRHARCQEAKILLMEAYALSKQIGSLLPSQIQVILYNLCEAYWFLEEYETSFLYMMIAAEIKD